MKITCKLCTFVHLEVGGLSHVTLLPLTLKTSSNADLCEHLRLNSGNLSFFSNLSLRSAIAISNINYIFLFLKITYFFNCNDLSIFSINQGFLSQTLTTHRTAGKGRGPSFIPLYQFHPLTNTKAFICNFACEIAITYF